MGKIGLRKTWRRLRWRKRSFDEGGDSARAMNRGKDERQGKNDELEKNNLSCNWTRGKRQVEMGEGRRTQIASDHEWVFERKGNLIGESGINEQKTEGVWVSRTQWPCSYYYSTTEFGTGFPSMRVVL